MPNLGSLFRFAWFPLVGQGWLIDFLRLPRLLVMEGSGFSYVESLFKIVHPFSGIPLNVPLHGTFSLTIRLRPLYRSTTNSLSIRFMQHWFTAWPWSSSRNRSSSKAGIGDGYPITAFNVVRKAHPVGRAMRLRVLALRIQIPSSICVHGCFLPKLAPVYYKDNDRLFVSVPYRYGCRNELESRQKSASKWCSTCFQSRNGNPL